MRNISTYIENLCVINIFMVCQITYRITTQMCKRIKGFYIFWLWINNIGGLKIEFKIKIHRDMTDEKACNSANGY